ncbi:hypothetical protein H5410_046757 [Solanum commersonii]|uniref:G-patch domain-containing protein n=1 Tax=Solanum commersonii TaxID=4109 RepID=A0A9J5XD58_SOLCO|nr:hypothetical protein H5410_046757 [Solanum commersonii]
MQVVRVSEEAKSDDTKLLSAAKMVASEMLKYGYQPKSGLGPKSNGIVEPIQLKHHRGTNDSNMSLPQEEFTRGKAIQSFDDHIVEGIGNLFVAMSGEEEEINLSKLTIRDAEPGEIL